MNDNFNQMKKLLKKKYWIDLIKEENVYDLHIKLLLKKTCIIEFHKVYKTLTINILMDYTS